MKTIEFFFDKYINHNPKKVWTGKFICITNFKNELHYAAEPFSIRATRRPTKTRRTTTDIAGNAVER